MVARLLAGRPLAQWLSLWEKISRLFARTEAANLDWKQAVLSDFLDLENAEPSVRAFAVVIHLRGSRARWRSAMTAGQPAYYRTTPKNGSASCRERVCQYI